MLMWFRRRQRIRLTLARAIAESLSEPRRVRIVHPDGRVAECKVARDPVPRRRDRYRWLAVVPHGDRYDPTADRLQVDFGPEGEAGSLPLMP
jgi:hypothetical protein